MTKTIRISDDLYEMARREAALFNRSVPGQIQHWIRVGVGMERMSAGPRSESNWPFARDADLVIPEGAFDNGKNSW